MATASACACSTASCGSRTGSAHIAASIALDRTGSGLERLVLLGKSGTLTLESLAWLRAIGAGLVHLSADGHVLTHSVPFGYDGHPIRRAQALAIATGLDVDLARDLIHRKLDGQRANLVRLRVADLAVFDAMREALDRAASIDEIRFARRRLRQSIGMRGRTCRFGCAVAICRAYQ